MSRDHRHSQNKLWKYYDGSLYPHSINDIYDIFKRAWLNNPNICQPGEINDSMTIKMQICLYLISKIAYLRVVGSWLI